MGTLADVDEDVVLAALGEVASARRSAVLELTENGFLDREKERRQKRKQEREDADIAEDAASNEPTMGGSNAMAGNNAGGVDAAVSGASDEELDGNGEAFVAKQAVANSSQRRRIAPGGEAASGGRRQQKRLRQ